MPVSEDILSSMVRYSEAREEKAPSSADGVSSSDDKVRRVTVRGVGDKNVGMPWWAAKSLTLWKTG